MGIIDDIRKDITDMEQKEHSLAMIVLKEYKSMVSALEKTNNKLMYVILLLSIIIGLFIGGLTYIVTNYDLVSEDVITEVNNIDTCIGEKCINDETGT
jgi:hypothetical protein